MFGVKRTITSYCFTLLSKMQMTPLFLVLLFSYALWRQLCRFGSVMRVVFRSLYALRTRSLVTPRQSIPDPKVIGTAVESPQAPKIHRIFDCHKLYYFWLSQVTTYLLFKVVFLLYIFFPLSDRYSGRHIEREGFLGDYGISYIYSRCIEFYGVDGPRVR